MSEYFVYIKNDNCKCSKNIGAFDNKGSVFKTEHDV